MWRPSEKKLFDAANAANNTGNYTQALANAEALFVFVKQQPAKRAYALGCCVAVALAHLGRHQQAEEVFNEAHELAQQQCAWAIASYILTDWSTLRKGDQAIDMATRALQYIEQAKDTPDLERSIDADTAFCKANLGRAYGQGGKTKDARAYLTNGRQALKIFAYSLQPRYEHAYLVALYWELHFYSRRLPWMGLPFLQVLTAAVYEVWRQRKLKTFFRLLVKR